MPLALKLDEAQQHSDQIQSLIKKYSHIDPNEIRRIYDSVLQQYQTATERRFLTIFVRKETEQLIKSFSC